MPLDALASTVSGMIRLVFVLLMLPRGLWAENVTVFAAASLKTALEEIAQGFERETDHSVTLSFAGSSVLARQISFGAPADVFISANVAWMDELEQRNLIDPASRFVLAGNRLVLVAGDAEVTWTPPENLPPGRIAMALVDAVPAGIYGKQALTYFDLWQDAQSRIVQTDNVRAALNLVALGQVPLGIVYHSDALAEPRVHPVLTLPGQSHDLIAYPAALTAGAGDAAQSFLRHLQAPPAQAILVQNGFTVTQ